MTAGGGIRLQMFKHWRRRYQQGPFPARLTLFLLTQKRPDSLALLLSLPRTVAYAPRRYPPADLRPSCSLHKSTRDLSRR